MKCSNCDKEIQSVRSTKKYCSPKCRYRAKYLNKLPAKDSNSKLPVKECPDEGKLPAKDRPLRTEDSNSCPEGKEQSHLEWALEFLGYKTLAEMRLKEGPFFYRKLKELGVSLTPARQPTKIL